MLTNSQKTISLKLLFLQYTTSFVLHLHRHVYVPSTAEEFKVILALRPLYAPMSGLY